MDDNKNNMEEFFRNSMEQFNDAPSAEVWEGIESGLDAAMPWYRRWFSWKKIGFGALIFLLLFGQGMFIQNYLNLKTENTSLETNNETLKTELAAATLDCQKQQKSLAERLVVLEKEMKHEAEKTAVIYANQKAQNSYIAALRLEKKAVEAELEKTTASLGNMIASSKEMSGFKNSKTADMSDSFFGNEKTQNADNELVMSKEKTEKEPVYTFDLTNKSPLVFLKKAATSSVKNKHVAFGSKQKLPIGTVMPLRMNWREPIYEQSRFRYGIESGFSTVFTDKKTIPQLSMTLGLRAEYFPWQNVGFTTALRFTNQSYKLENIAPHVAAKFPALDPANTLTEVEVNSNYFDLYIGMKFLRNKDGDNTSVYINPAFAAQVYLPQKYEYKFATGPQYSVRPSRYFLYLGNVHLGVGLERKISSKMTFQYGIWAEKSLQHIGLEERRINVFGLQTALLFN